MKAVGYVRVSSKKQDVSPEAQAEKIREYCGFNEWELAAIYSDKGISGKKARRPGLMDAMNHVKIEKGTLVVYSLSRFSRGTVDCIRLAEELRNADCGFASLTEKIDTGNPQGRFFFTLMAALAQLEREMTSDRMLFIHQHKREKGEKIGNFLQYGYDLGEDGKTLVPNDREKRGLFRMEELRRKGRSLREIAAVLEEEGFRPKEGRKWHPGTIGTLLKRHQASVKVSESNVKETPGLD